MHTSHIPITMDPKHDPEYKIVIAQLVPNVCALIMAELADIHIELGRLRWRERIAKVNAGCVDESVETINQDRYIYKRGLFSFCWRTLPIGTYTPGYTREIYNKLRTPVNM